MEAKVIIAESVKSGKNNVTVWLVSIPGEEQGKMYCKGAYKALRYAFLLKKRTGVNISENCIAKLSQEIRLQKEAQAAAVQEKVKEVADALTVNKEEPKPKARRQKKGTAKTVDINS